MEENHKMTRRQVVAGLGTTLAAVAVSPVLAATNLSQKSATLKHHLAEITRIDKQLNTNSK